MPEEKLGAWAIGQSVSPDFGAEGLFTGTVTAYSRKDGETDLYELEYEDGDREEVATEGYKFARALWIQKWGCEPEKLLDRVILNKPLKKKPRNLAKLRGFVSKRS